MIPKPKTEQILEQFNVLRLTGKVRDFDFPMAKLKREIESLQNADEVGYHQLMTAFYALTGKHNEMLKHGNTCINRYGDEESVIFAATSYTTAGLFAEARTAINQVEWDQPTEISQKTSLSQMLFMVKRVMDWNNTLSRANLHDASGNQELPVYQRAQYFLEKTGISEQLISRMLDLAGELLHEKGLLNIYAPIINPDVSHEAITIQLPIGIPADEVANLEWEYALRLFDRHPEWPTKQVFIGFSTAYSDD